MDHLATQPFSRAKFAAAIGALVAGSFAWFPLINSVPGPVSHWTVFAGLVILVAAFLPLALLAPAKPRAPLQIALGIAVGLSLLDTMSLPAPPRAESITSFIAFFLVAVLAVTAHLLAAPRPRVAFAALAALGVIALYFSYAVDYYATSTRYGAAVKGSTWPVAVIAAACLAACWHGRHLLVRSSGAGILQPHSGER